MKYDFTTIMDRHGMDAIAVDGLSEDGQGSGMLPSYRTMKYKSPIWGYFHVQKE